MKAIFTITLLCLLVGCATKPPLEVHHEFAPVRPLPEVTQPLPTGSIMSNPKRMTFFQGQRRWQVGDIVTIILSEATQASRNASVIAERKSTNDAMTDDLQAAIGRSRGYLGEYVSRIAPKIDLKTVSIETEGGGTAAQANALTGVVTTMVVEVMPNGNLVVEGRKQLSLTEGAEFIQVRGVLRARDIQPDNTVSSMRMAQAQISYRGTGNLADSAQPGWLSQFLFKYWPL